MILSKIPQMYGVAEEIKAATVNSLPFMKWEVSDRFASSIILRATIEPATDWTNGIFHNAGYVIITISPMGGRQYFDQNDTKVTLELIQKSHKIKVKLRKCTCTVDEVVTKLQDYFEAIKKEQLVSR